MSKIAEIFNAIQLGKKKEVVKLVEGALAEGLKPLDILNDGMIGAMGVVGEKFREGAIFVPEMIVAARAMKAGVEVLRPYLVDGNTRKTDKFIIGTVDGDLHDIGKNLVAMMIESSGFTLIDLGVDVKAEKFIQAIKDNPDCRLVGLSCLLTTTMPHLKDTIDVITEEGLRNQVKILIGGAPITQEYADKVGADGFAADAGSAADMAKKLVAAKEVVMA